MKIDSSIIETIKKAQKTYKDLADLAGHLEALQAAASAKDNLSDLNAQAEAAMKELADAKAGVSSVKKAAKNDADAVIKAAKDEAAAIKVKATAEIADFMRKEKEAVQNDVSSLVASKEELLTAIAIQEKTLADLRSEVSKIEDTKAKLLKALGA